MIFQIISFHLSLILLNAFRIFWYDKCPIISIQYLHLPTMLQCGPAAAHALRSSLQGARSWTYCYYRWKFIVTLLLVVCFLGCWNCLLMSIVVILLYKWLCAIRTLSSPISQPLICDGDGYGRQHDDCCQVLVLIMISRPSQHIAQRCCRYTAPWWFCFCFRLLPVNWQIVLFSEINKCQTDSEFNLDWWNIAWRWQTWNRWC